MIWADRIAAIIAVGTWFGLSWVALSWAQRHQ